MGLFGIGAVKPDQVLAQGEAASGRLVGIAVSGSATSATVDHLIEVDAEPTFRAAIRFAGAPDVPVRLGMELDVVHLDGRVAVDWTANGASSTPEPRYPKTPPEEGITDRTLGLDALRRDGIQVTGVLEQAEVRDGTADGGPQLHLTLRVERTGLAPYQTEVGPTAVPHYATHLCAEGRSLPLWVRPERPEDLVVDWPAAATADPGIGEPDAPAVAKLRTGS